MNPLVFLTTLARAIAFSHPTDSDVDMKLTMFGCESYVYWTVHRCDSWRIKDQLDVIYYFIDGYIY